MVRFPGRTLACTKTVRRAARAGANGFPHFELRAWDLTPGKVLCARSFWFLLSP